MERDLKMSESDRNHEYFRDQSATAGERNACGRNWIRVKVLLTKMIGNDNRDLKDRHVYCNIPCQTI